MSFSPDTSGQKFPRRGGGKSLCWLRDSNKIAGLNFHLKIIIGNYFMRTKLVCLLGLIPWTLTASPLLETKPAGAAFEKFSPLKAPAVSGQVLHAGDRLAICGDSITEQKMYSRLMEDYLTMCVPQLRVTVRQYGWSGERVPGFLVRMTNDCLRFHPTLATTCYGMNDHEYRPYEERIGQTYETNSVRMVEAFKANGVRVILGSPGNVSKMPGWVKSAAGTVEDLNLNLCQLRNRDIGIARREKVIFADLFWPMFTAWSAGQQRYGADFGIPGGDGVHPHWAGHTLMAYAFLKAMGLDGNLGTFTVDWEKNKIHVTAGHEVVSAAAGEFTISSSRYPFCPSEPAALAKANYPVSGQDEVASDNSIRAGMTLIPFNQDLNRLTLVVQRGEASQYRVTWGDADKIFTREQLAHGINLAAEFPVNPFSAAFAKVDAAVVAKQVFETKEMKEMFRRTENRSRDMAQITAQTERIVGETEKEHAALAAAVQAAFVPVTHVLKITAL